MRPWCLLLMLGCASSTDKEAGAADDTSEPAVVLGPPDAPGPYAVGTDAITLIGSSGVELLVQVWYPTWTTGSVLYHYLGAYSGLAQDGPEPACGSARPVLAFSHGNTGVRWQSTFLTEYLASHGFVVVAPDHTGNTTLDFDESRMPELIFRRPQDISDSVDGLFSSADEWVEGLSDCVDPEAGFAISGHSFGGYTTVAVAGASFDQAATQAHCATAGGWLCEDALQYAEDHPDADLDGTDARVWAAIPQAPAGYEVLVGGLHEITAPMMVLGGSRDEATPMDEQVRPIYDGISSSPRYLGNLMDGGHFIFSNACELISTNEECGDPYLPASEGHPELATLITAFLRMVQGEPEMAEYLPPSPEMWTWTAD